MKRSLQIFVIAFMSITSTIIFASSDKTQAVELKQLSIAMILWRDVTVSEKAFMEDLEKRGYSVNYSIFDAAQDSDAVNSIITQNILPNLQNFDYIYTFGTTVSMAAKKKINNRVPQIFNIVVDPVGAGLVETMTESKGNIAGVSNQVSLEKQLENVRKIMPFQSMGFLYNPLEDNSILIRNRLRKLAAAMDFQIVERQISSKENNLEMAMQIDSLMKERPDFLYLPADSYLISQAEKIAAVLNENKIKSAGAVRSYIEKGILIGTVADYENLGSMAALIIHWHQNGEKLENIPVQIQSKPQIVLNASTAKHLMIKIPEQILEKSEVIK